MGNTRTHKRYLVIYRDATVKGASWFYGGDYLTEGYARASAINWVKRDKHGAIEAQVWLWPKGKLIRYV